jgi:hypothetical protein
MLNKPWKKVRVIVELRVPPGDLRYQTQRRLKWWVQQALEKAEEFDDGAPLTTPKVKFFSAVQGYETRVLERKVRER